LNTRRPVLMGLFALMAAWCMTARAAETPVSGLIDRIAPGHGGDFVIETIAAPAGENVFEVEARNGKVVLRGDGPLSQSVALNWYLKHDAHVAVSWYADDAINVPERLPLPAEKIRRTTKLQTRFFLNYCTFGYSFPWWQWRDWERFVDWMALNGINLPLAQGGTEAIWQKVWRSYGLTDEEISRDFFTGPAHLPWNRMGNIDKWDGPLPQSYIDGQLTLTQRIVQRERQFGMKPILPAFAGHVPGGLARVHPQTKLTRLSWCGVSTNFIGPQDPLFREIQVKFLRAQEKELGTDHYYGTDPFNEMTPPSWEPAYLASVSKAIYEAMAEADPDAVWVQMAWTFRGGGWTNPRLEAMIKAVPPGRMMLLDYFCEDTELWRRHKFFGAPFVWDYLGNFGGNTVVRGPVNLVNERVTAVMNDASLSNFAGIGSTLEGLNNQSMYEFLFQRAWEGTQCDTATWLRTQAQCHAGVPDAAVESAYATFWLKALGGNGNDSGGDVFMMVPRLAPGSTRGYLGEAKTYKPAPLVEAWKQMLDAAPASRMHDAYRADLVEVTRLALTTVGDGLRRDMFAAYQRKDAAAFKKLAAKFIGLGHDLDALLGTRSNLLFGKWVADARAWGKDAAEADYYERNARTIVTTWMGRSNGLNDYAGRDWNGLLSGYYLGRWQMYLDAVGDALAAGKEPADIDKRVMDFEWKWAQSVGGQFKTQPEGDCYEASRGLYEKYSTALPVEIATWSPANTPAEFAEIRWPLPATAQQRGVLRLRLQFEAGNHALEIRSVALKAGDKTVAEDRHDGWTGDENRRNVYTLTLPSDAVGEKLSLVVTARGAGGTLSSGSVLLESEP
jgi:alpha-N-acetylglucosaminidase